MFRRTLHRALGLALALVAGTAVAGPVPAQADPISQAPGHRLVDAYTGAPAAARPLPGTRPPQHPYLAPNGRSGMHADGWGSATYGWSGPLGEHPRVDSERMALLGGECANVTFDRAGRIVTVCGTFTGFLVKLLDPRTLATLAEYKLPQRPSTVEAITRLDFSRIFKDTSGGAYSYLDDQDRLVLADSRQHIVRLAHRQRPGGWEFTVTDDWDLTARVPHDCVTWTNLYPTGTCDPVTSVMPDWQGRIWWVTRQGRVGTVDPGSEAVRSIRLDGEEIQNSFSVAADGVSIVSDHALYEFTATADGTPAVVWRQTYDRGTGTKPGSVNQGSGTTPDIFGEGGRYVAITDNADDRMHVLVYRRGAGIPAGRRPVCEIPVFRSGASTTDNSLISWGDSLVVENNHGYENVTSLTFGRSVVGGVTRIDVRPDGSGCDMVWASAERSPSVVPKLSTGNGLLYLYTKDPDPLGIDAWYLTAVDFRTGRTRWKQLVGTGAGYDNNWAPITLGPDGTAYVGVFNGLAAVRDDG
ncbi:hypothetical protein SAMN05428944_0631 [Streptomyces sp. 1222.5]|uniref:hypothetical protein n=1 Tax=unclassified Streptomyces TaxID=2593676 RepID=UPI0008962C78|nr:MULTISPECIES: hypothetical protein [unclassified Streptomyces]PKW12128.1 hypothetical protein BX260_7463 [Streptomyces sp. 5112.2]SEB62140.1 hypothetical protein SAMN05428944_0631 [Streptomyces sp. 1222.5]